MDAFLEEQTFFFSSLVRDVFCEPLVHIDALQVFVREEMRDLDARVRSKMQQLRVERGQEFFSSPVVELEEEEEQVAELEEEEEQVEELVEEKSEMKKAKEKGEKKKEKGEKKKGKSQKEKKEKSEEKKGQNGKKEKRQKREHKQKEDAASSKRQKEISALDEGCFYGCEKSAVDCVCCDGCENWFHARCAGYESELCPDPVHEGESIQLSAFCNDCLEARELTHADILSQQEEYLRIEKFFRENANQWKWKHVSQDGRCCLHGIWSQYAGKQFDTFEDFVVACAKAAFAEVAASGLPRVMQRSFAVVFKELAKSPLQLSVLWPKLDVEFLWLGLTKVVLPNVQTKLFELEYRKQNRGKLRCIQSFPEEEKDEGEKRDVVFYILQWNRKVAAHFDLLEVIDLPLAVPLSVPHIWPVGSLLEAELMDERFSDYKDTIYPVEVVEVLKGGKEYRCRMLAFEEDDAVDVWPAELLHKMRDSSGAVLYKHGDQVHIRIRKRKVHGKFVDGLASKKGIWVKGVVFSAGAGDDGRVVAEHVDWDRIDDDCGAVLKKRVGLEDLRVVE